MEHAENEPGAAAPPSGTFQQVVLQPGQLSKPEKVWASSSTLVIGFYQAPPFSEAFKIFYKKSGAVFGTQVMLTPASILGPELAIRQPVQGEAQYFEYEIKKLKPSTQYVIKIKTTDDTSEVRSDKMATVSLEEERTRDNDMRNFVGALVKLGDYDGLVTSFTPSSGIFAIRILQIDDVSVSLQLARLNSDYTDNGVPVQAYTLSQVRFGRWGGAITGSKVVNEGELKWLVARAVQMSDKTDAASLFEERRRMLQMQVEKVTVGLEMEWSKRFGSMRIKTTAFLILLALLSVVAGVGLGLLLRQSGRRNRELQGQLNVSARRQGELEAELQLLHLYRVSLELDVARRVAIADGRTPAAAAAAPNVSLGAGGGGGGRHGTGGAAGGRGSRRNATDHGGEEGGTDGDGGGGGGAAASKEAQHKRREGSKGASGKRKDVGASSPSAAAASSAAARGRQPETSRGSGGGSGGGSGRSHRAPDGRKLRKRGDVDDEYDEYDGAVSGGGGSLRAKGSRRSGRKDRERGGADDWYDEDDVHDEDDVSSAAALWGLPHQALRMALHRSKSPHVAEGVRQEWVAESAVYGEIASSDEQPDAWAFIHYVSNVYAMHLQEWMKVQLQKNVRRKVNDMLLTAPPGNRSSQTRRRRGGGDGDQHSSADDDRGAGDGELYDSGGRWCSPDGDEDGYDGDCLAEAS